MAVVVGISESPLQYELRHSLERRSYYGIDAIRGLLYVHDTRAFVFILGMSTLVHLCSSAFSIGPEMRSSRI
jgi:hypothetical protein